MPISDPEARRKYAREWVAKRRADWFSDKVCVDCGAAEDLQLDHVDPKSKVSHSIWSWSEARRLSELIKCVVRCSHCHAKKTMNNKEHSRGVECSNSKLTPEAVKEIRSRSDGGESGRAIARSYGLSECAIRSVLSGRTWAHI